MALVIGRTLALDEHHWVRLGSIAREKAGPAVFICSVRPVRAVIHVHLATCGISRFVEETQWLVLIQLNVKLVLH